MIKLEIAPKVQIFATDLDEHAVAVARHGRYRKPLSGISPDRLERWFVKDGDDYCVKKDVREMCVFSVHNVTKDPPFSKLDLLSCRNLMIYLDAPLQNRLMRTFHYALRPSTYLFLGASEGVSRHGGLFNALDKKHRLFQRRDDVAASLPSGAPGTAPAQPQSPVGQPVRRIGDGVDLHARHALEKYSPAYLVINRQHEVLRFSGRTGHYVEHSSGAASFNLFDILRKELLPTVRIAVQRALATRKPVIHEDMVVPVNGHSKIINLIVEPISEEGDGELYVVAFQDRGLVGREGARDKMGKNADARVQALEKELRATRLQLQSTIDDAEAANEELKSSNEEYQSVNEEFQSANEELESSKEELQSINEELHTINAELSRKNEALAEANSDIKNLLDSTQIATLFLDNDLRIKNFTPTMAEIFHVRAGDRGRPITEIVTRLNYAELARDVKKVLRSFSMVEQEVAVGPEGATFVMRIRPYRTVADVIGGVVITFIDISERKRHEEELARFAATVRESEERFRALVKASSYAVYRMSPDWSEMRELQGGDFIIDTEKPSRTWLKEYIHPDDQRQVMAVINEAVRTKSIFESEHRVRRADGTLGWTLSRAVPVLDARGEIVEWFGAASDVSERKRGEELRILMVDELNHRVKNTLATVQSIAALSLAGTADAQSREAFDARLVALSRTHDLLASYSWKGASLRDLLLQELAPYHPKNGARAVVEGPDVGLKPKAALAFGMAFHELATNAAKYGALSNPTGQVRVTWDVESPSESVLRLKWAEIGGPPVTKTGRKGFGSKLIERGLSLEVNGTVQLDLDPGGLVCTIEMPLPTENG